MTLKLWERFTGMIQENSRILHFHECIIEYRPGTTTCFYCGLLVPVAELLTRHSAGNNECFGRTVNVLLKT